MASKELRKQLLEAGFHPKRYEGQKGEFLVKLLVANQMPAFMRDIVDEEIVFESDRIIVEVCPDDTVQLVDQDNDYHELPVPVWSEQGRALLQDAGFSADDTLMSKLKRQSSPGTAASRAQHDTKHHANAAKPSPAIVPKPRM